MKIWTSKTRSFVLSAVAGIAALGAMQTAIAGVNDDPPTLVVKYADLNLQSTEGAQTLYRRIKAAAHQVCAYGEQRNFTMRSLYAECFNDAVNGAVEKVNVPSVTALRDSKLSGAKRS